jgi:hypothetical protein
VYFFATHKTAYDDRLFLDPTDAFVSKPHVRLLNVSMDPSSYDLTVYARVQFIGYVYKRAGCEFVTQQQTVEGLGTNKEAVAEYDVLRFDSPMVQAFHNTNSGGWDAQKMATFTNYINSSSLNSDVVASTINLDKFSTSFEPSRQAVTEFRTKSNVDFVNYMDLVSFVHNDGGGRVTSDQVFDSFRTLSQNSSIGTSVKAWSGNAGDAPMTMGHHDVLHLSMAGERPLNPVAGEASSCPRLDPVFLVACLRDTQQRASRSSRNIESVDNAASTDPSTFEPQCISAVNSGSENQGIIFYMNEALSNSTTIGPPGMVSKLMSDTSNRARWVDFTSKVDSGGYENGELADDIHEKQYNFRPFQEAYNAGGPGNPPTTYVYVYTGNQTGHYTSKSPFTGKPMAVIPSVDHTTSSPSYSGCQFGWWLQLPSVTAIYDGMESLNELNEVMFEYMAIATVEGNGVEQSRRSLITGRSLLQTTPTPAPATTPEDSGTGMTASHRGNWDSKTVSCGGMDINVPVSGPITCTTVAVETAASGDDDDNLHIIIPVVTATGGLLILILIVLMALQMASYRQQCKLNTMMSHPLLRSNQDAAHESGGGAKTTSVGTVMSTASLVLGRPRVDTLV